MSVGYFASLFHLINVRDRDLINQARARCAHLVLGVVTDDCADTLRDAVRLLSHGESTSPILQRVLRPAVTAAA